MNVAKEEPIALVGFVSALLALLVAFGISLTAVQQGAIVAFVGALWGLLAWARAQVTPTHKIAQGMDSPQP